MKKQVADIFSKQIGWERKLTLQQMHVICQQMTFALTGGMSLPGAVLLVAQEIRPAICSRFLKEIGDKLQQGQSMTQAVETSTIRYSPVFLEFVMAGEQNGTMRESMEQASVYFAQQNKTRQMLASALFYPAILLILMVCAFTAMFLFVVPAVVQTYDNFGASLPAVTRWILQISRWFQENRFLFPVITAVLIMGIFFGFKQLKKDSTWQKKLRNVILHTPAVGKLYQQYWFVQISQAMGLMLSGGMLLSGCLKAVGQIYKRSLFASELETFYDAISSGYTFQTALAECTFVPDMARQMLRVSEQSGVLADALLQLSQYYQHQVQQKLHRIISLLEPCCVVLLGLGILLMAGGLFLPLVQSYQYLL